jgi:hypothetical protein
MSIIDISKRSLPVNGIILGKDKSPSRGGKGCILFIAGEDGADLGVPLRRYSL